VSVTVDHRMLERIVYFYRAIFHGHRSSG